MVGNILNRVLCPSLIILFVPNLTIAVWFTITDCEGSFYKFIQFLYNNEGLLMGMRKVWSTIPLATSFSVAVYFGFCLYSVVMMLVIPGKQFEGPPTVNGAIPVYKDNGFRCYMITLIIFFILTAVLKYNGLTPTIVYDRFGELLVTSNLFSFIFCLILYLKGKFYPRNEDHTNDSNFIFDYYWGVELYPRLFGIDVKVFTNCRFGMTVWGLLVYLSAIKSYEEFGLVDNSIVTALLQSLYIIKFFWWETGYYCSLDFILDHGGFYLCWGCLVFMPGICASTSLYTGSHPVHMGWLFNGTMLLLGLISLVVNYWADKQKQEVRKTDGNCLIWGNKPQIIRAKYTLHNGEERSNVLLASGWWGVSRHFNYLAELSLAFALSATSGFTKLLPFTYFIFLFILLTHRSMRDDTKCSQKYGKYWDDYKKKVPYKIVPYMY